MGYTVDTKSWPEIQRDYGPNGLLGYDLVNGYAEITSYTQLAAYSANALLLGATRGQTKGKMAPFIRYVAAAQREWAMIQHTRRPPERALCWVSQVPELRRRCCMDTWMLDTLRRGDTGTPEEPQGRSATCGALTGALMVLGGLGYQDKEALALLRQVREGHGATDCATLLRTSRERGEVKKAHCDGLVFEMVEALDRIAEA